MKDSDERAAQSGMASRGVKYDARASIVEHLTQVDDARSEREAHPGLKAAVQAVKQYQQQRFTRTYADLLQTERYAPASRFFLEELYGPSDFSRRDTQFARAAPAFVRLLPFEVVHTIDTLAKLHAVSESLDTAMGRHLNGLRLDAVAYTMAWRSTARAEDRAAQIALTVEVGAALDRYTRKPLLKYTLRAMRAAARTAGFGDLQRFLESGFSAFIAMKGASDFLQIISQRETALAESLFSESLVVDLVDGKARNAANKLAFAQLP